MSGTWNSSRVAACAMRNERAGCGWPVSFASHRQPLYWNFMYHSRIVLSEGGSVWYAVQNLCCTVTIDSVLANSKTQNAFLFPFHAMFCHDCLLAAKHASTPWRLGHKKFGEILYLLICSPSAWPSRLLYRRGRISWRDLWITLYKVVLQSY
jgi:hypothetical protein